jgi:hypothetical protein
MTMIGDFGRWEDEMYTPGWHLSPGNSGWGTAYNYLDVAMLKGNLEYMEVLPLVNLITQDLETEEG